MRNLKKVLGLVLCLAMMLSIMVVGAGAVFADQKDIDTKHQEAVDACSTLNIITGFENGKFMPNDNVTREQTAKMICVLLNGGKDPVLGAGSSSFTDVANNRWSCPYIESCVSQDIIVGVGNNKFAPAGKVTGSQLAKMLLVALGFSPDHQKYAGSAWEVNVNTDASAKGFYDKLEDINPSQPLTREHAAQMIWNALQAYEVEYKTTLVTDSKGQLTSQITVQDKVVGSTNDKITLLRDKYDAWMNVGTLVSVDGKDLTITMSNSDRAGSDTKDTDFTKLATDYSSLLGQKVKVIFKNGKANDVLGVYATGDNTIYKALMNDVELDGSKVKFDGKSYSVDNTSKIKTIVVGLDGTTISDKAISYFDSTVNSNNKVGKLSLNEVTFVDTDDNGKIDTAIVIEKVAGEVTYTSSDKITLGSTTAASYSKSYKYADENISKDLAKDDWAVISQNLYKDCKDITKATVVNGTLDGVKDKTGYKQFKVEGTWYNISDSNASDVSNGDTVQAYIVNGVIVKIKSDDGKGGYPTNIAVVVSNGTINGDQVRIRYFDGTSKLVTISDNTTVSLTAGTAYKVSGADTSMKFENVSNIKYNGYLYAGTGNADPTNDKAANVKVDDSAAVILYDGLGRSKMLTGKQYNALSTSDSEKGLNGGTGAATAVFTKETKGLTRAMMVAVKTPSMTISGNSSDNYAYVVSNNGQNKDGNASYTIWTTDNKYVDVIEENATAMAKGELIGYSSIDSNGVIKDVTRITNIDKVGTSNQGQTAVTNSTSSFAADGTIYYGSNRSDDTKFITVANKKLKVTADTAVLFVDSAADEYNQIGVNYTYGTTAMAKAEEYAANSYSYNVMFMVDETKPDDVNLKVLVVDTTGAFDGQKHNDPTTPSVEKGDYTSKFASVKVADKSIVTDAASSRNVSTNVVTVALTLGKDVKTIDATKISVKKDGTPVVNPDLSIKSTDTAVTVSGNQYIFTVAGVGADETLSIEVADGFDVTTYTATLVNGIPGVTATLSKETAISKSDKVTLSVKVAQAGEDGTITVKADGCAASATTLNLKNGKALDETVTLTNFTKNATITLTYAKK